MGYLEGFAVTFAKLFEERVTGEYPKEKSPKPDRLHGRHVLNRYEDGMEKCIGCELCAGVCPAHCSRSGWSSGSKYPLLGAVRASAQMVSYEAALGLALAAVLLQSESLSTHDIVQSQVDGYWNVFGLGFIPFIVFLIAGTAELNRPPFDLVEAEQELVGGFHTEYSSLRFSLFFLAEFMNLITMSAIMVTLFFGGLDDQEKYCDAEEGLDQK